MSRPLLTRRVPLGDEYAIAVHADNGRALDLADLVPADSGDTYRRPVCAELFVLANGVPARRPPASSPVRGSRAIREHHDADGAVFIDWFGKAQALVSAAAGRAVITLSGARRLNPEFLSKLVIRPVLDRLLERRFVLLHAAGAVCNGQGIVIAGNAGAGKTTLLSGLLDAGMGFLADDRVIVDPGDSCRICRFPEFLRRPATARGPKRRIVPESDGPAAVMPSHVLILEAGGDALEMLELPPAETAARLIRHASVHDQDLWPRNLDTVASICARSRGFLLRGWGSAGERVAAVLGLMGESHGNDG